jgi:hypothetical protein
MRFRVMRFRFTRFGATSAAPLSGVTAGGGAPAVTADPPLPPLPPLMASGECGIGHPLAESQRAGIDYLIRISVEQAAARRCSPAGSAETGGGAEGADRAGPDDGLPSDDRLPSDDGLAGDDGLADDHWDETPETYPHI